MFHIQESKKNLMRWMHYSFFFFFSRRIFDLWNSKFLVIKAPQKMSRSHWFNMCQRVVVKHPQQYDRQAPSTTSIIKTSNERTPFRISCFIPTVELYTSKKYFFFPFSDLWAQRCCRSTSDVRVRPRKTKARLACVDRVDNNTVVTWTVQFSPLFYL